jgi:hypothetical protein
MITCKNCGNKISKNDKHCGFCGAKNVKKPFYKKWWFWVIIAFIFIGAAGSTAEDSATENNTNTSMTVEDTTSTAVEEPISNIDNCKNLLKSFDNINDNAIDILIKYIPDFETDFETIAPTKKGAHEFKLTLKNTKYTIVTFVNNADKQVAAIIDSDNNRIYDAVIKDGVIINRIDCEHQYEEPFYTEASYITNSKEIITCSICGHKVETITGNKLSPISFCMNNYEIDYLGGITIHTSIRNNTDKEIKYVYFTLQFLNAVGDVIQSEMYNSAADGSMTWQVTGPITSYTTTTFSGHGFYNSAFAGTYRLVSYTVIFMDDTQIAINGTNMNEYDSVFID